MVLYSLYNYFTQSNSYCSSYQNKNFLFIASSITCFQPISLIYCFTIIIQPTFHFNLLNNPIGIGSYHFYIEGIKLNKFYSPHPRKSGSLDNNWDTVIPIRRLIRSCRNPNVQISTSSFLRHFQEVSIKGNSSRS